MTKKKKKVDSMNRIYFLFAIQDFRFFFDYMGKKEKLHIERKSKKRTLHINIDR